MLDYDLTNDQGKQEFERWIVAIIRNEVNAYIQEVLFNRNTQYIDGTGGVSGTLSADERITRLEQATFRR
jgi:predicted AAA+ superfamily ATPase